MRSRYDLQTEHFSLAFSSYKHLSKTGSHRVIQRPQLHKTSSVAVQMVLIVDHFDIQKHFSLSLQQKGQVPDCFVKDCILLPPDSAMNILPGETRIQHIYLLISKWCCSAKNQSAPQTAVPFVAVKTKQTTSLHTRGNPIKPPEMCKGSIFPFLLPVIFPFREFNQQK